MSDQPDIEKPVLTECEKWAKVIDDVRVIMDFSYWAEDQYADTEFKPSLTDQLYAYFQIDPVKLEEERRALLEYQRRQNEKTR